MIVIIYVFIPLQHQSKCLDLDVPIRHRLGLPKLHRLNHRRFQLNITLKEWGYKSNVCEPKETQQEDNC